MNNVFVGCVISVVHHLDFLTGKVASIAVVNSNANPKTNKCSMSSKVHYTKSEYNKDDDREDHKTYASRYDPFRHRFIRSIVGHFAFQKEYDLLVQVQIPATYDVSLWC